MKLTLWVLITLAAVSGASPGNKSPSSRSLARREDSKCTDAGKIRETDRLLFSESIETFIKTRDTKNPSCLDWSSDACSSSPDGVLGLYDFTWSCMRHDFGYRNAKAQKRCTHSLRQRIDDNFWGDMMRYCDDNFHWYSWFNKQACKGAADSYYQAVRDHGRDACGPAISKAVSEDGQCGKNGLTCKGANFGDCCSKANWCGNTIDHCGSGCQDDSGVCH